MAGLSRRHARQARSSTAFRPGTHAASRRRRAAPGGQAGGEPGERSELDDLRLARRADNAAVSRAELAIRSLTLKNDYHAASRIPAAASARYPPF
jgi:hypothetical protein